MTCPITIYGNVYVYGPGYPAAGFGWHVGPTFAKERLSMDLNITLTDEQKIRVAAVAPKTAAGHPALLDGPVTFELVAGDCTIEALDGTSCMITSGTAGIASEVTASADADLGAGVVTIMDRIHVQVLSAMAADLGLVADAPALK
jgi:hypothetical protein